MVLTAPASAKDRGPAVVRVTASGEGLALSHDRVDSSVVRFDLDVTRDGPVGLQVLQLRKGVTLQELFAQADGDQGAFTRALDEGATWYGGIDVNNGQDDAALTLRLRRGTYLVVDLAQEVPEGEQPDIRTLRVTRNSGRGGLPKADARVDMDERHGGHGGHGHVFEAPDRLPAAGTVEFRNQNDIVHFAAIAPVRPGSTDAQVQAVFDAELAGDPPPEENPFFEGTDNDDSTGLTVLSAGERAQLTYDVPPGTYVILCFFGDEVNGLPHAYLGMHKVVELR